MKEYKNFKEFYEEAFNLAKNIKALTLGMSAPQRVAYARKYIERKILNNWINISCLSKNVILELKTSNDILKFSTDNLLKNLITHSDVCFEDYLKIPDIAKNPSKILESKNGYDVMLFKKDNKYYKLIVKTTKNKDENFVKSFHLLKEKRYEKYQ